MLEKNWRKECNTLYNRIAGLVVNVNRIMCGYVSQIMKTNPFLINFLFISLKKNTFNERKLTHLYIQNMQIEPFISNCKSNRY